MRDLKSGTEMNAWRAYAAAALPACVRRARGYPADVDAATAACVEAAAIADAMMVEEGLRER